MIDLCECKTKKEKINEFFKWLLDKDNVELQSELDLSLASSYYDPNIYYPKELCAFFNTKAMRRLGKISQLGLVLIENKYCYHNRLEHSKGTYNKKVEELIFLCSNPEYRKYIEDNNMKIYLIAELIKEAGHDIGHLPLSHIIEYRIIHHKGYHEIIGKRILTEDPEIQRALSKIDSRLPEVLKYSLEHDVLNFKAHDESNYDVDRLDYLNRDSLHYDNVQIHLPHEEYTTIRVATNSDGTIKNNPDGSVIVVDSANPNGTNIDVYDYSSLFNIENFLATRFEAYKHIYYSKNTQLADSAVGIFLTELLQRHPNQAAELQKFINQLANVPPDQIDLDDYLSWTDFKFYKNCIDVARNNENKNFRDFATMVIPPIDALMDFTYSSFDLKHRQSNTYSQEEEEILNMIQSLISGNDELSKNIKKPYFFANNCRAITDKNKIEQLQQKWGDKNVHFSCSTIKPYKASESLYIRDKNGNIYPLEKHPNRSCNWDTYSQPIPVGFLILPQLRDVPFVKSNIYRDFTCGPVSLEER
ncbi:MAG: hypothetical protein J6J36_01760 [Clostridia bacterium]|nr:hypothetical protein [Clostridia bacterium]